MSAESQAILGLHAIQDLFKGELFSLAHSIVEFDAIRLFLLVLRLDLEVVGLVDDLKELANIVLDLTLLTT